MEQNINIIYLYTAAYCKLFQKPFYTALKNNKIKGNGIKSAINMCHLKSDRNVDELL